MDRIIADQSMWLKLQGAESPLEVVDAAGQKLGYYVPASETQHALYAQARSLFTEDQIASARAEAGGFSTADVLARLRDQ